MKLKMPLVSRGFVEGIREGDLTKSVEVVLKQRKFCTDCGRQGRFRRVDALLNLVVEPRPSI